MGGSLGCSSFASGVEIRVGLEEEVVAVGREEEGWKVEEEVELPRPRRLPVEVWEDSSLERREVGLRDLGVELLEEEVEVVVWSMRKEEEVVVGRR